MAPQNSDSNITKLTTDYHKKNNNNEKFKTLQGLPKCDTKKQSEQM